LRPCRADRRRVVGALLHVCGGALVLYPLSSSAVPLPSHVSEMIEPPVEKTDDSGSAHVAPAPPSSAGEARPPHSSGIGPTTGDLGHAGGLYQLLVESVRDYAIFALDPKGMILSWNAGAERIKGYSADEIIGRHFSIFYTAEDLAARKPEMELVVAEREGRVEDEGWRVRKDGSCFWASVVWVNRAWSSTR